MKSNNLDGTSIMRGEEVSEEYVDLYKKSHTYNIDYNISYMDYIVVNNLFDSPYTVLITFGGTAGYVNFFSNAKEITIVDLSQKMLDAAFEINKDKKINLKLIKDDVLDYFTHTDNKYDFVDLGAMGAYIPFSIRLIQNYFDIVNKNGILVVRSLVVDRIFDKGDIFRLIFNVLYKTYRVFFGKKIGITVQEINRHINSFLDNNNNAKILIKSVGRKGSGLETTYTVFLKKL